ncbi:MAG: hypothetical protein LBU70_09780 [Chitinispirillales bacterium]|jgi:hypothetical protein|nr:hypothetical protein [Chitinispirillales bacterium]
MFKKASVVIVLATALTLCVTGCKKQEQAVAEEAVTVGIESEQYDERQPLANETDGDEITHDPDFSVYGTWNYVVTSSTPSEWEDVQPSITIKTDNTVSAHLVFIIKTGVISKINTYQFRVNIAAGESASDEWDAEEWILTYNPKTNLLEGWDNAYFRRGTDADGSASDAETKQEQNTFTDPRDNQTYRTVRIGNLTWMAQNLNHVTNNSWCYDDNASNCEK